MGAAEAVDLADSAPTAKTLNERAVLAEPHLGQGNLLSPLMERTSCSNLLLHFWQVYS
jgi:hypothetical protein